MKNRFRKNQTTLVIKCIILFIFIYNNLFSQNTSEIWYNVVAIPPSPNAASLGKYGEVPIDKSTGVPNISIPLLQLSEGGIDVSVSVSYHAGGIRVQDESSSVGLGWSLNAGGVITRTMRGLPDEYGKGFLENAEKVPWSPIIDLELATPGIANQTYERLDEMAKGFIDYEPDAFYYNYGGGSGSFMFGNHKQPINIPDDNVLIKPYFTSGKLAGFIITSTDGMLYVFGDIKATGFTEKTHVEVQGPDQQDYISSWYLQKIVNPLTQSEVNFTYYSYSYTNTANYSYSKMYENNGMGGYDLLNSQHSISTITINNAKILNQIQFKNGIVNFESSISEDGIRKFDSILFKDQKYIFSYDYFKVHPNSSTKNELRLRLSSISETSPEILDDKKYTFEYSTVKLPKKSSNSIDFWGFYNNKNDNSETSIPFVTYAGQTFGEADRQPDSEYSKAGTLTKINYPTGGSSEFSYENNAVGRRPTIPEISISGSTSPLYQTGIEPRNIEVCNNQNLIFDPNYKYWHYVLHAELSIDPISQYDPLHHKGKVQITNDANILLFEEVVTYEHPLTIPLTIDLTDMCTLTVCVHGSVTTISCWITYEKYDPDKLLIKREFLAGGLRIKQINNFDPIINSTKFKTFDYDTSGYLNTNLPYYYTATIDRRLDAGGHLVEYNRLMVYSSPVGGLGCSSNSVSYEKVIEYNGTPQLNSGKIATTFEHFEDGPSGGTPYLPQISYQFLRSKVRLEEYFNFLSENNYNKVKWMEYSYEDDTQHINLIRGFKVSRIMTDRTNTFIHDYSNIFSYQNFTLATFNKRISHIKTHEIINENNEILTKQDYFYENPRHFNATKIETMTSDDKIIKTILKYPLDYVSSTNDCLATYEINLDNCKNQFEECSRETLDCLEKYGYCYENLLARTSEAVECYWDHTVTYNYVCDDDIGDCWSTFSECLSGNNGYLSCMDNINCGYMPCIVEANVNYSKCIANYYASIKSLYEYATDPDEKGIYLMAWYNINNSLIEKIVYSNDQEIEHYKFSYNEYLDNHKPVLVKAANKINGNQNFNTVMTYDKYDDNLNVTQTTPFGIGSPTSYIWGYNQKYLIAQTKNATATECGYTGFENNEGNSFSVPDPNEFVDNAFSGRKALNVTKSILGARGATFLIGENAQNHYGYKASVWVKGSKDAYLQLEVVQDESVYARAYKTTDEEEGWQLIEVELPRLKLEPFFGPALKLKVYINTDNKPAIFDDLRFQPMDAQMTTYTYDPLIGVTSSSDPNNKPTKFEYDGFGRLILVRDYMGNILKKNDYHYKP